MIEQDSDTESLPDSLPDLIASSDDEWDSEIDSLSPNTKSKQNDDLPPLEDIEYPDDDVPPLEDVFSNEGSDGDLGPIDPEMPSLTLSDNDEEESETSISQYQSETDDEENDEDWDQSSSDSDEHTPVPPRLKDTLGNRKKVPTNIKKSEEKNKREWEEYQDKKKMEKEERELQKELRKKKLEELASQNQDTYTKTEAPTPIVTPTVEVYDISTCLICEKNKENISNRDDYYTCMCSKKCRIHFHKNCWLRFYRSNKNTDKSIDCPTEACGGFISDAQFHDKDSEEVKITSYPAPTTTSRPKKKIEIFKASLDGNEEETKEVKQKTRTRKQEVKQPIVDPASQSSEKASSKSDEEEATLKVTFSAGKFSKAVEKNKLMLKALEITEKNNKKIYNRANYPLKPGHEIGIVVEIEQSVKILTTFGFIKGRWDETMVGDMVQFPYHTGYDYVKDLEVLERPENLPENFHQLYTSLQEQMEMIKTKFDAITFKTLKKKKKGSTSTSNKKKKPKEQKEMESITEEEQEVIIDSRIGKDPTKRIFEFEDLSEEFVDRATWWLGSVLQMKEMFGTIQVVYHPPSVPIQTGTLFLHVKNVNPDSVRPQLHDNVIFTCLMDGEKKTVLDLRVVSNTCREHLLTITEGANQ